MLGVWLNLVLLVHCFITATVAYMTHHWNRHLRPKTSFYPGGGFRSMIIDLISDNYSAFGVCGFDGGGIQYGVEI